MRKFIYITIITGLIFAGCEPNEELYEKLDKEVEPYSEDIEHTLSAEDYSTITSLALARAETAEDSAKANAIETFESFSESSPADEYIPMFLADEYAALDKTSTANVTYDFYEGEPSYLSQFGEAETYTLTTEDYDAMGEDSGEPGEYDNFSDGVPPEDYLPGFLSDQYPDAEEGDMLAITYDYYSGSVEERTGYYYLKDGEWQPVPNVYVLTADDYDSMGEPGNYDNFSSSVDPDFYIPIFLEEKYMYASEGDEKVIVYDYFDEGVSVRAKKYVFDGDEWKEYNPTKQKTDQYIHNGSKWVFDPTVKVEMEKDDYHLIVEERESKYIDSYGTGEFYSGANSHYVNFDIRPSERVDYEPEFEDLSDEEAEEIMWERILLLADEPMETRGALHVMLQKKFPEAKPTSSGVDVFYEVTFEMYTKDLANPNYTATYQCVEAGNPDEDKLPEFEFIETDAPYNGE